MVLRVKAALKKLSSRELEVLRLRYDEGLPSEEIAKNLGVKKNEAAALIDGALRHVSQIYVNEFGPPPNRARARTPERPRTRRPHSLR